MHNMKMCMENIVRWGAIVGCGGYGAWQLFDGRYGVMRWNGDWLGAFVLAIDHALIASPFLAVAYLCLCRQYRKLFLVVGVVGAIVLFGALMALPEWLGIEQYFRDNLDSIDKMRARPWLDFIAGPFFLLCLFGPIFAAAWFYRFCHRLAFRSPDDGGNGDKHAPKTQATRWLVWLGLLLVLLPPLVDLLVTFHSIAGSPTATVPPEPLNGWILMTVELCSLGVLLMFLGLVRRRPIPGAKAKTSPPNTA
jgi:hypothetical protein